jgi:hypothetical protein
MCDSFRRLFTLERNVPLLRVKKRELFYLGCLIALWMLQWMVMVF